jgi:hypothetical protein
VPDAKISFSSGPVSTLRSPVVHVKAGPGRAV